MVVVAFGDGGVVIGMSGVVGVWGGFCDAFILRALRANVQDHEGRCNCEAEIQDQKQTRCFTIVQETDACR